MDLDLCINCDQCVKACESLHGRSVLIRTGIHLGKDRIPSACRHCDDPKCMNSCPTGAIKRRPEGEIYFQYDMCIGCANCAIACPYDNIAMIDTPTFDKAQARKSHTMNDASFFRPYPVAAHEVGETGLWARIMGVGARVRKSASRLRSRSAVIPITFRRPSPSSAISATVCRSWDVCIIVPLAPRSESIRLNCSSKLARLP